jgi:mitogen-activated protein kinase kinase
MATPIRKKRNFRDLRLEKPAAPPPPPPAPPPELIEPVPTRLAPEAAVAVPGKKKRPPPMKLNAPKIPPANSVPVEQDSSVLSVVGGPSSAPPTATASRRNTYHTTLSNTLANLDMNAEIKYDLRNEDLKDLHELGQGNGGSVKKVEHVPTGTFMAKKVWCFHPRFL